MLKNIILLSSFALVICLATSCKKDDNPNLVDAIIIEDINGTAGCEWFVNVNGTEHVPLNLSSDFRTHFLEVKVDFTIEGDATCGGKLDTPKEITINEIEER